MQHVSDHVELVDSNGEVIGTMEKLRAHREAALHRAISVFIYNSEGKVLLQKRADGKYHSPGLWTNTCCSHPYPGESSDAAALRRLKQEMGFETNLRHLFRFVYKAELENGLTEHELDDVYAGVFDAAPSPDPEEISEWKYVDPEEVLSEIKTNPEAYTIWFRLIFARVNNLINEAA